MCRVRTSCRRFVSFFTRGFFFHSFVFCIKARPPSHIPRTRSVSARRTTHASRNGSEKIIKIALRDPLNRNWKRKTSDNAVKKRHGSHHDTDDFFPKAVSIIRVYYLKRTNSILILIVSIYVL